MKGAASYMPDENAEKEMGKIIYENKLSKRSILRKQSNEKEWKLMKSLQYDGIYEVMILLCLYLHHTINWGLTIRFQKAQRGL